MEKLGEGIFYRIQECYSIIVFMVPGKSLYFHGKCSVKVLKGIVDIYGCHITPETQKLHVFSLKDYDILSITCLSCKSDTVATEATVDTTEFEKSSVFVMEMFENGWCDGFRRYSNNLLLGPGPTGIAPSEEPHQKLTETMMYELLGFQIIPDDSYFFKGLLLKVSPKWDELLHNLQVDGNKLRMAIFGGKGVGKSTYFRRTVNKCLSLYGQSSVLCIDLDPGQTEFTPPGLISVHLCREPLLGPNFTHLSQPMKSIFLGCLGVDKCVPMYISGLLSLCEFVQDKREFADIPWIINTMGFATGAGVNLACEIIKIFRPKTVVQIEKGHPTFPFDLNYKNVSKHWTQSSFSSTICRTNSVTKSQLYDFFKLDISKPSVGRSKGAIRRKNCILSYFSHPIAIYSPNIQSVIPRTVHLEYFALGTMNLDLPYASILENIRQKLVVFCNVPNNLMITLKTKSDVAFASATRKYIQSGMLIKHSCYGFAIVLEVDLDRGLLYVLTPVPSEILENHVNAIISADAIEIPPQLLKMDLGNEDDKKQ